MNSRNLLTIVVAALASFWSGSTPASAQDGKFVLHSFDRQRLTDVYFSEGANAGDINGDGKMDVVYGPYWFEGPKFTAKHEIYNPVPQNREGYANNFFSWIYDFNSDGWKDILVVGFPGTPAYVYENPQKGNFGKHWKKHTVFDWVSNESPHFVNIVGDERPELVCTRDGFFGFATVDWKKPFASWTFHPISGQIAPKRFGHGLGVGDVNGDGRMDIIHSKGWFEQPKTNAESSRWQSHEATFSNSYGCAEMYAYDVDGDGDNDIITSHAAHDFGLAWYEQVKNGDKVTFKHHLIMGSHPSDNRYGVVVSELHSLNLVDMDGDGLKDIVTGRTFYSHHKQSPMWDAGAVVYWFRLVRGKSGVNWLPYQADGESGIGRQLSIADINGDKLPDIVVGGMKGAHVLTHKKAMVTQAVWQKAQPKIYQAPPVPSAKGTKALRGPKAKLDARSGRAAGGLEGEALKARPSAGWVGTQAMASFKTDRWSDNKQLFWRGCRPGDTLHIDLPEKSGLADLEIALTCARDYAIVQLALDNIPLGNPIDLYSPNVTTTGVLIFPRIQLKPGPHTLTVTIIGANAKATKAYMFGLDYVRFNVNPDDAGAHEEKDECAGATDGLRRPDENDNRLTVQRGSRD